MKAQSLIILCFTIVGLVLLKPQDSLAQHKKKKGDEKKISLYDIDTLTRPIPKQRDYFQAKVDKAQRGADATDGVVDKLILYPDDSLFTQLLTKTLLVDIDQIQVMVENMPIEDPQEENQTKIRYLRAVENVLNRYNRDTHADPYFYRKVVISLKEMMIAHHENNLVAYVSSHPDFYTLENVELLEGNTEAKSILYTTLAKSDPEIMIRKLPSFANEPYAEAVVEAAARVVPNEVYSFASSTNSRLNSVVRRSKDPLVQTIVRIADQSNNKLKAMSFLDDIHSGRKTIAEIDKITADPNLYYKNLVRLKMEQQKLGGDTYTADLKYRGLRYIREMNDLHESPDAVRFRCIEASTPEEIYYMLVFGQDEVYTSSYIGAYNRMMEKLKPRRSDELLQAIHYDNFRTWLRMCAGYNTLDNFLSSVPAENKNQILKDFAANLEKGKESDLEDAVDLADAFASIKDPILQDFLRNEVRENYKRVDGEDFRKANPAQARKGIVVYGLLVTLFHSTGEDSSKAVALSQTLNLPPVNFIPYQSLVSADSVVYEQLFFYGDEDGKMSYDHFLGEFRNGKWKVDASNPSYTKIVSVTGKRVEIYASKPIQSPEGADEKAQQELQKYLDSRGIKPSFIVHRGHSYHLGTTIENMIKANKIVMLGSCGGYHNLGKVLDQAPDAQIISTKQTGTMEANDKIISTINERLINGQDVNWIDMWNEVDRYYASKGAVLTERFREYIPPFRNLGAIFIKAYRRAINLSDQI